MKDKHHIYRKQDLRDNLAKLIKKISKIPNISKENKKNKLRKRRGRKKKTMLEKLQSLQERKTLTELIENKERIITIKEIMNSRGDNLGELNFKRKRVSTLLSFLEGTTSMGENEEENYFLIIRLDIRGKNGEYNERAKYKPEWFYMSCDEYLETMLNFKRVKSYNRELDSVVDYIYVVEEGDVSKKDHLHLYLVLKPIGLLKGIVGDNEKRKRERMIDYYSRIECVFKGIVANDWFKGKERIEIDIFKQEDIGETFIKGDDVEGINKYIKWMLYICKDRNKPVSLEDKRRRFFNCTQAKKKINWENRLPIWSGV